METLLSSTGVCNLKSIGQESNTTYTKSSIVRQGRKTANSELGAKMETYRPGQGASLQREGPAFGKNGTGKAEAENRFQDAKSRGRLTCFLCPVSTTTPACDADLGQRSVTAESSATEQKRQTVCFHQEANP